MELLQVDLRDFAKTETRRKCIEDNALDVRDPCRDELPYVEKLYHHFQNRDDVAILALNMDDYPAGDDTR